MRVKHQVTRSLSQVKHLSTQYNTSSCSTLVLAIILLTSISLNHEATYWPCNIQHTITKQYSRYVYQVYGSFCGHSIKNSVFDHFGFTDFCNYYTLHLPIAHLFDPDHYIVLCKMFSRCFFANKKLIMMIRTLKFGDVTYNVMN